MESEIQTITKNVWTEIQSPPRFCFNQLIVRKTLKAIDAQIYSNGTIVDVSREKKTVLFFTANDKSALAILFHLRSGSYCVLQSQT